MQPVLPLEFDDVTPVAVKPKQRVSDVLRMIDDWLSKGAMADEFDGFVDDFFAKFEVVSQGHSIKKVLDLVPDQVAFQARFVALEAFLSQTFREGYVFDQFRTEKRPYLAPDNLAYFSALRGSSMSLYQAIDVVPKSHVIVHDVLFETEPIIVEEILGTTWMSPGGYFGARIVQVNRKPKFSGAFIPLSRARIMQCLKEIELSADRLKDHSLVHASGDDERINSAKRLLQKFIPGIAASMYLVDNANLPVKNAPKLAECEFPIMGSERPVQTALDSTHDFERYDDTELEWDWIPEIGSGRIVEATVSIENNSLQVAAESPKSLKAVQSRLRKLLGDRLGNAIKK